MLAQDFLSVLDQFPEFECYVPPRKELDITNQEQVEGNIKNYRPDILLNCAAYTKVDKAETESARAFLSMEPVLASWQKLVIDLG